MVLSSLIFFSLVGGLLCFALAIILSIFYRRMTNDGQYLKLSLTVSLNVVRIFAVAMLLMFFFVILFG